MRRTGCSLARLAPLAGVLFAEACSLDVPSSDTPHVVHARFDPKAGVLPKPTDVLRDARTGLLAIPTEPEDLEGKSPAEVELIRALNRRDGWPSRTPAEVAFSAPLRASSVDAESVRVFHVRARGIERLELAPRLDPEDRVVIDPPPGGWERGGVYFVAALGGPRGLRGEDGEAVVADAAFYLLRARAPLTEHLTAIPGASLDERRANAERLEILRQTLAPFFDHLETLGLARGDVVALWSFTITAAPEIVFDKAAGQMPLPSDFLRDPASGLVDLPVRADDSALRAKLKRELRELDGFALSADLHFDMSAPIDPASLAEGAVRLFALDAATGEAREVPVTVEARHDDAALTVRLADRPLAPATEHLLVVTDALTDPHGRRAAPMIPGALALLESPVFEAGASTLASIDGESAARIEPVRRATRRGLEAVVRARLLDPERVVSAWPFRTLSIIEPALRARDAAELFDLPPDPIEVTRRSVLQANLDFPLGSLSLLRVDEVFEGFITVPDFLDPLTHRARSDGTFEPRAIRFTMTIPRRIDRDAPLKVALFGHAILTERRFVLALGDALAEEGIAVIAVDLPLHGERTHCAWSGPQCVVNPLDQAGDLICPNPCERRTTCAPDGRCVDSAGDGNALSRWPVVGFPQASGGAFLEVENLMGTRDHFRQGLVDLSALERSLRRGDWKSAIGFEIDPDLSFVGQSLGGIIGAVFAATHPSIQRVVLNVPGGDLVDLFRESGLFHAHLDAFFAREGITPGTDDHALVLDVARWIMDGVDPQNFAEYLAARSIETRRPMERDVLIQMATLDMVIGNEQTKLLERLSGVPRRDYIAEHAFLVIPVEPAYFRGTRDLARFLGQGVMP